jgi:hypothetical protein
VLPHLVRAPACGRSGRPAGGGHPDRAGPGRGLTKPGTLLKHQVPIRTFADWDQARPGFLELDLVAHCGPSGAGELLFTLGAVDVCTGWSAWLGVRNRNEQAVFAALCQLRQELPFPLRGLDCDNGGEFITKNLVRYCRREGITLTRARPWRQNDACHAEQKNRSVVRRLVGYARFEGVGAVAALNHLYAQDPRRAAPRQALRSRADPYRRLLATGSLSPEMTATLATRYAAFTRSGASSPSSRPRPPSTGTPSEKAPSGATLAPGEDPLMAQHGEVRHANVTNGEASLLRRPRPAGARSGRP